MIDLPDTIEARRIRVTHGAATASDMSWLRVARSTTGLGAYVCDCRCQCHRSAAPTATGATPGSCGLSIDLETFDCGRSCRAAHILASDCNLDEGRPAAHV